jgi:GTP pyrophosphokinase
VYSVYKKMQDKKLQSAEDINDMLALRIIIESPDDELIEKEKCMQVYNIITNFYKPRIEQFRDYISNPKPNGYKAIHTTVMGPEGRWVEVQIRTHRMHDFAERGVAAHWKYKKVPGISSSIESGIDKWMAEVHRILLSNDADSLKILDDIKLTLYSDEIFVWTPRGQLLNMPRGSTVLDFAYRLHSDLGNRCIGANLNRRNVVPLNHVLLSGDQIEIIESKNSSPKDEYLNYIITSHAKLSLKEALRKKRQKLAPEGRKKLEKLFEEYNVEFTKKNIDKLFSFLRMPGPDELFYEVYRDNFLPENIQRCFKQGNKPLPLTESSGSNEISYSEHKAKHAQQHDLDKFKVLQSECCHPLPGDDVIAYSTDERLYQLHRISCGNAIEYSARFENRTLYGNWENRPNGFYLGGIRITGFDRRKMIFDIINVIDNEMKFDIKQFHIGTTGAYFEAEIIVAVHNRLEIEQAIDKLKQLDKILDVQRIYEFKLKNG